MTTQIQSASEQITEQVTSWPGVRGEGPGERGEFAFLAVDNRLEIEVPRPQATLVDGPDGLPLVDAPDARGVSTQAVRSSRLRL